MYQSTTKLDVQFYLTTNAELRELVHDKDMHAISCIIIIMAALHSRCGHYTFDVISIFFVFFPRLISVVGDWMSTILPHTSTHGEALVQI